MVFLVGVKRNPTLVVQGEIEKLDREAIKELAIEYLEKIYFIPTKVIKKKGYAVVVLEPEDMDF